MPSAAPASMPMHWKRICAGWALSGTRAAASGGPNGPYYQSECAAIYTESYNKLEAQGLVYPCFCSRAQLHAASAPHTSDGNVIYPGTCRGLTAEQIAEKRKEGPGLSAHGAR